MPPTRLLRFRTEPLFQCVPLALPDWPHVVMWFSLRASGRYMPKQMPGDRGASFLYQHFAVTRLLAVPSRLRDLAGKQDRSAALEFLGFPVHVLILVSRCFRLR